MTARRYAMLAGILLSLTQASVASAWVICRSISTHEIWACGTADSCFGTAAGDACISLCAYMGLAAECHSCACDTDGDGVSPAAAWGRCSSGPMGTVPACDCDDSNGSVYPLAPEINDGVDNQCPWDPGHGIVDEIDRTPYFPPGPDPDFCWTAQTGAAGYQVLLANAADFSTGCDSVATPAPCVGTGVTPLFGQVRFMLVRPISPHTGSWGVDSSGAERTPICP